MKKTTITCFAIASIFGLASQALAQTPRTKLNDTPQVRATAQKPPKKCPTNMTLNAAGKCVCLPPHKATAAACV